MRENRLRRFGHTERRNTNDKTEKMGQIRVKGNRGQEVGQKRSGWRSLGGDMRACETDEDMVRNREG